MMMPPRTHNDIVSRLTSVQTIRPLNGFEFIYTTELFVISSYLRS